ncbi:Gfo/Idh/MocA family oxidoreductase [Streptacidiphilus anmyonensis]|uniref:Gfo/Idh/MocA family oxidoreductase n=1 Tax=Streptacidiphilus anmyonensis TaxID=405782 RepID=UPI0005A8C115|nr:Gfo/Idh/MocA family oxidoreductase [Streptacidiphilus anmyonensis]
MLRTLVVGLGRAGAGLHLPVLAKARRRRPDLFAPAAVIGVDRASALPAGSARDAGSAGSAGSALGGGGAGAARAAEAAADGEHRVVASLAQARQLLDPERTVVHVCTPPVARTEVVTELLELGFRRLLLEKPPAADPGQLARLLELLRRPGVQSAVVAPWLASTLTARLVDLVEKEAVLGRLRRIEVVQNKPRFQRSFTTSGHPTAFDVEVPHALGVALRLAGDAEVVTASCTDLDAVGRREPRLGGATVDLVHHGGVRTAVRSDLTSPVRERRITLRFDGGTAVGHYAADASDHHAQLRLIVGDAAPMEPRTVLRDDALTEFFLRAYEDFAADGPCPSALARQARVVELIGEAKRLTAGRLSPDARRELAGAH